MSECKDKKQREQLLPITCVFWRSDDDDDDVEDAHEDVEEEEHVEQSVSTQHQQKWLNSLTNKLQHNGTTQKAIFAYKIHIRTKDVLKQHSATSSNS